MLPAVYDLWIVALQPPQRAAVATGNRRQRLAQFGGNLAKALPGKQVTQDDPLRARVQRRDCLAYQPVRLRRQDGLPGISFHGRQRPPLERPRLSRAIDGRVPHGNKDVRGHITHGRLVDAPEFR